MSERTTITIPTKTHLKKFLLKMYDAREPFHLDMNTSLGRNLMSSMVDKLEYVNVSDQYIDQLRVTLSSRFEKRGPRIKRLIYINSLLEEMFKEHLILWIYAKMDEGINPNQSTKDFLAFFNIDESEYTYAAAYKAWQKYKERNRKNKGWIRKFSQQKVNFLPNLSPNR